MMIGRERVGTLLRAMVTDGSAAPDAPAAAAAALRDAGDESPWFVRFVAGGAAWVASLFFAGFLELLDIVSFMEHGIITGIVLAAAAIGLRRLWPLHEQTTFRIVGGVRVANKPRVWTDFGVQLALALSLLARFYFAFGVSEWSDEPRTAALALAGMELVFLAFYVDTTQRFLSTALFGAWLGFAAYDAAEADVVPRATRDVLTLAFVATAGMFWTRHADLLRSRWASWVTPVGYGLVVAASGLLLDGMLFAPFRNVPALGWPLTLGVLLLLAGLAWHLLRELDIDPTSPGALVVWALLIVLAAIGWREAGVPAALALLALAFRARERWLLVLGVLFTLAFGAHFYYDLDITLLVKSGVLLGSGIALLAARWALDRWTADPEPGTPA